MRRRSPGPGLRSRRSSLAAGLAAVLLVAPALPAADSPERASLADDLSVRASQAGAIHEDVPADPDPAARWLFYLHGAILEQHGREAVSPYFGPYRYDAILEALAARGFEVVSEVRRPNDEGFVARLVGQVGRLRDAGVPAERIGVVGGSWGGHLALAAAARVRHPDVSYVVVAGCNSDTPALGPELKGRVLSIYDASDRSNRSCQPTFDAAPGLSAAHEIVVDVGLGHGLLYRPVEAWLEPAVRWVAGDSSPEAGY